MKGEWSSHSAKLSSEHSAQLTAERERALQSHTEAQTRHEAEKRELEQSHAAKVRSTRLQENTFATDSICMYMQVNMCVCKVPVHDIVVFNTADCRAVQY